jgi:hypothetical protein
MPDQSLVARRHAALSAAIPAGSIDLDALSREETTLLWAHAASKVFQPAAAHGFRDLQPVGFSRISRTPQLVTGTDSEWLILPADLDPLYQQGQLAAPRNVRAHLRELVNAGVWFDSIAIAHEVPPGAVANVRNIVELQGLLEPPMPKSLPVLSNTIGSLIDGAWRIEEVIANFLRKSVDPVIFGAVVANPPATDGAAAMFFIITRWDY